MNGGRPDSGWGVDCKEDVDIAALLSGATVGVIRDGWLETATGWGLPKEGTCVLAPKVIEDDVAAGDGCEVPEAKGFGVLEAGVPKAGGAPKPNGAGKPDADVGSCADGDADT